MVYRLVYFDDKGKGEAIRLLFSISNVDFEDVRVNADKWKEIKDSTPTGLLPLVELEGSDELEWAAVDAIVCCISDMMEKMPLLYRDIPLGLKTISSSKGIYGKGDYLVGCGLSYADISLYSVIDNIHDLLQIEVELPENLKSLKKAVESNPGIADYLKNIK
ncbi:hypothetical protein GJ496_003256 [Pomphorhynchus laevis]|nr:hypothetical protein GJ496_003256 [Pomphorhynchus laevis]